MLLSNIIIYALSLSALSYTGVFAAAVDEGTRLATAASDRILIKYADSSAAGSKAGLRGLEIVPLEDGEPVEQALERLNAQDDILYAEPDYQVQALLQPTDSRWSMQWGPAVANVPAAWDVSTGDPAITVCVIDTGIDYSHTELAPNMHPLRGWDALTQKPDPMDQNGHGTHCAGVIGAASNNSAGIVGINWKVQMLGCKFMDASGVGYMSGILACLDYCVQKNATISSNSYALEGLDRKSSILKDAITQAAQKNHIFVAAAGNTASDNDANVRPSFPAAFSTPNIVSVAALEAAETAGADPKLAPYSNYGATTVHVAAPGSQILSTWPGNWLAYLSGTSMAAPHVAGILALLKAATGDKLTNAQLREVLLQTTQTLVGLQGKVSTGGMVDAGAAMTLAMKMAAEVPQQLQSPLPSPSPSPSPSPPPSPSPNPSPSPSLDPSPSLSPPQNERSVPWKGIPEILGGSFRVVLEVNGFSCAAFARSAQGTYSSALRFLAGARVRDVKTTCKGPALYGKERVLQVTFKVSMSRGHSRSTAAKNIMDALQGQEVEKVTKSLGDNYNVKSFNITL